MLPKANLTKFAAAGFSSGVWEFSLTSSTHASVSQSMGGPMSFADISRAHAERKAIYAQENPKNGE
jgi:hypothetical protein